MSFVRLLSFSLAFVSAAHAIAQNLEVPRRHDHPPGPPISAEEAIKKMTVPAGFHVEIVAAEPDLVNPVAMAIDEQGRFWVTESLEYPRLDAGAGLDRIKVLEDTDGDGKIDKTTLFADGLNIPSGIAVGHGGVWVVNSPDLLFFEDTDGDLKADKRTVLLTGFGRTDTHELPSALTWGPDGYLYGLNGVFNNSRVKYAADNPNAAAEPDAKWDFTCALWRIDPWTKKFEIFAQGTSNPWGIAMDNNGQFILSACVIDHLWHFAEDGYYIRQGGPYPANTWPLRSIVNHHHQKAAYCGITYYDSDAYPREYRKTFYMGNIHGGCLNADVIEPTGSSYFGTPKPDFVTGNDSWFMPVSQLTGRDGNLYILDWYDQYHCYQDAQADPAGIERAKGRLYRLVYDGNDASAKKTQMSQIPLHQADNSSLFGLLKSENGFERWTAQRLLSERSDLRLLPLLVGEVTNAENDSRARHHALWSIGGMRPSPEVTNALSSLCIKVDGDLKSWCIRLLGNAAERGDADAAIALKQKIPSEVAVIKDPATCLPLVSATAKCTSISASERVGLIAQTAMKFPADQTVQHIAYNCICEIGDSSDATQSLIRVYASTAELGPFAADWSVRLLSWSQAEAKISTTQTAELAAAFLTEHTDATQLHQAVVKWIHGIALDASSGRQGLNTALQEKCGSLIEKFANKATGPLAAASLMVRASWGDAKAASEVANLLTAENSSGETRVAAAKTLIAADSPVLPDAIAKLLMNEKISLADRSNLIDTLGRTRDMEVAQWLAANIEKLDLSLQPKVIELMTQRPTWATLILNRVEDKTLTAERFNLNQMKRLAAFKDEGVKKQFTSLFGTVREGNTNRQAVVSKMVNMLDAMRGDPHKGHAVFTRVCSQCHQLYGEGVQVGPDITRNGRNNWQQLIQNVFDPSAVIGPGFLAVTVLTSDDRIVTGIPVEETDVVISLKIQGGKIETIASDDIEDIKRGEVSLMPEQLELQMTPQETADLFAYLALDKPPQDLTAVLLPGAPPQKQ